MIPFTQRQLEALQTIAHFWRLGYPPTTGEMRDRFFRVMARLA